MDFTGNSQKFLSETKTNLMVFSNKLSQSIEKIYYPGFERSQAIDILKEGNRKCKILIRDKVDKDEPEWKFVVSFYDKESKEAHCIEHPKIYLHSRNTHDRVEYFYLYGGENAQFKEEFDDFRIFFKDRLWRKVCGNEPFPELSTRPPRYFAPNLRVEYDYCFRAYKMVTDPKKFEKTDILEDGRIYKFQLFCDDSDVLDGSLGSPNEDKPKPKATGKGKNFQFKVLAENKDDFYFCNSYAMMKKLLNKPNLQKESKQSVKSNQIYIAFKKGS